MSFRFNFTVITNGGVTRMTAREQHASRRSTNSVARVMLSQPHTFSGQLIKTRRLNLLLTKAADFPISHRPNKAPSSQALLKNSRTQRHASNELLSFASRSFHGYIKPLSNHTSPCLFRQSACRRPIFPARRKPKRSGQAERLCFSTPLRTLPCEVRALLFHRLSTASLRTSYYVRHRFRNSACARQL